MNPVVLPAVKCFLNFSWFWNIRKSLVGSHVGVGSERHSAGQLIFRRPEQQH